MPQKNVLVTGGAGFIGSNLVDTLVQRGDRVTVLDNLSTGLRENLSEGVDFRTFDLTTDDISSVMHDVEPDVIFHLSANGSVPLSISNPLFDATHNVMASVRLFDACARLEKQPNIIFASTGGALSSEATTLPTPEDEACPAKSPYALAKRTVEEYARLYQELYGLPILTARFSNVYGPRQRPVHAIGILSIFLTRMLGNQPVTIHGDGEQTRDYVYVDDAVQALLLLSDHIRDAEHSIYNVGFGKETSVNEIFHSCAVATGYLKHASHDEPDVGSPRRSCLDTSRIQKEFGWKPTVPLAEGIRRTVEWNEQQT